MPKVALSRAIIVEMAMQLVDEKGYKELSLRAVASRLGVHVTSLYNHVPTKDALIDEMAKALIGKIEFPQEPVNWQEWIRQFANAMRKLVREHPGIIQIFFHNPAQEIHTSALVESALGVFRSDGFDEQSSFYAVRATTYAVLGVVLNEMASHQNPTYEVDLDQLPSDQYPNLNQALQIMEKEKTIDYLIDALIAGISVLKSTANV